MDLYDFKKLKQLIELPECTESMQSWLDLEGLVQFLEDELEDKYILLYAASKHAFLQPALIPAIEYSKENIEDLKSWSGGIDASWSFNCSRTECTIENPSSSFHSNVIATEESILHAKSLEGVKGYENYYEINQKITQALDLHYIHDKKAWYKLDENGDLDEVIKTINIELNLKDNLTAIVINQEELSKYTAATNQILLRMISFRAYEPSKFTGWDGERKVKEIKTKITTGCKTSVLNVGSFFGGIQLLDISMPMKNLIKIQWDDTEKQYASYIINDFKYKKITEISCNPNNLDSYFGDTGKPFSTSPAFFNIKVLRKYKSNSEKYTLKSRFIECRGTWYLRLYDINTARQVSAYLCDLNQLPYREQLHWKQYNENPKAPISERAFKNNFLGEFSEEESTLDKLKRLLTEMINSNLNWWSMKVDRGLEKLHYPYTDSKNEWGNEVLNFHQVIIEGFDKKSLKNKAKELNANVNNKLKTLKILERILVAQGYEEEDAYAIMSIFHELNTLRNKIKGHVSGTEAEQLRKEAIKNHGSYEAHFENMFEKMLDSLGTLYGKIL